METDRTRSRRGLIIGIAVAVVFLAIVAGAVFWALSRGDTGPNREALRAPFESAMRKASVEASFPAQPVELGSVTASGGHPFSATFTAEELGALLNTFSFTADIAGSKAQVRRAGLRFLGNDVIELDARVEVDGSTYSAVVEAPVEFRDGAARSRGATRATAEGISLNAAQRAQLTNAVLAYVNAYLQAAPGLDVGSARLTPDGIAVTGTAPDRLEYP